MDKTTTQRIREILVRYKLFLSESQGTYGARAESKTTAFSVDVSAETLDSAIEIVWLSLTELEKTK